MLLHSKLPKTLWGGAVKIEVEWNAKFVEYEKKYSEEAAKLKATITGELLAGWEKALPVSKLTNF